MPLTKEEYDDQITKYRCKQRHAKMYNALVEIFDAYTNDESLREIHHTFNTNINEALNKSVTSVAPKDRCYGRTISMTYRLYVIICVHSRGYLWTVQMLYNRLGISASKHTLEYFKQLDRRKDYQKEYQRRIQVKKRRRAADNQKIRDQKRKMARDIKEGLHYSSGINGPLSQEEEVVESPEESTVVEAAPPEDATESNRSAPLSQVTSVHHFGGERNVTSEGYQGKVG